MNEPIEISNLADYINEINTITHSNKIYLYRGQENEEWQVNSSAYRRLEISVSPSERASVSEQASVTEYNRLSDVLRSPHRDYLLQIVNEIQLKYPSTYRDLHPLECMAHLQHNKVATGLIDFTFIVDPRINKTLSMHNQPPKSPLSGGLQKLRAARSYW